MKPTFKSKKIIDIRHSQLLNEIWSAITHGIGFFLSIAGTILLLIKAIGLGKPLDIVAYTIYGLSLLVLFFSSTMFHSLYFTKASHVFQILDHDSINFNCRNLHLIVSLPFAAVKESVYASSFGFWQSPVSFNSLRLVSSKKLKPLFTC